MKIRCAGEFKPTRGTQYSAGIDLYNNGEDSTWIKSETLWITDITTMTGVEIPHGYVGLVFVRSGLGFKGIDLINSCGVIDSDYRGDIALRFTSLIEQRPLERGERVAQLVIVPYNHVDLEFVDVLDETERGTGGFGSTGRF